MLEVVGSLGSSLNEWVLSDLELRFGNVLGGAFTGWIFVDHDSICFVEIVDGFCVVQQAGNCSAWMLICESLEGFDIAIEIEAQSGIREDESSDTATALKLLLITIRCDSEGIDEDIWLIDWTVLVRDVSVFYDTFYSWHDSIMPVSNWAIAHGKWGWVLC